MKLAFVPIFLALLQGAVAPPPRCRTGADPRPWLDAVVENFKETAEHLDTAIDGIDGILGKLKGKNNQLVSAKNDVAKIGETLETAAAACHGSVQGWMSSLGFISGTLIPCIILYDYLQPYPDLVAQIQSIDTNYVQPAKPLIRAAYDPLYEAWTVTSPVLNSDPQVTVGQLKTYITEPRKKLAEARKFNNKALPQFERVVDKLKDKLKTVALPTTTTFIPEPTPTEHVCGVNEVWGQLCDTCANPRCESLGHSGTCTPYSECSEDCICQEGYYRDVNKFWACVPAAECPVTVAPAGAA
ncbi:hypothetical protein HK097_007214 [Rhizophlyctis rosea]|uniref:TIL domain-containing protein n=1 Tax=Rhizophlyctis rosea TaxID=64517 RepID=A0AAD5SQK3_9FUNG|nr:hypothetical protein HK097_007214 [Rhizophlyctis rosea]